MIKYVFIFCFIILKSTAHTLSNKHRHRTHMKSHSKSFKFNSQVKTTFMMTSRFTPTKKKQGANKDRTGKDWCSSEDNGGPMQDCLKVRNLDTSETHKCDEKVSGDNMEAVCKVESNAD